MKNIRFFCPKMFIFLVVKGLEGGEKVPPPLGVWEGLRFVIVALPGLFSYLFFSIFK